MKTKLNTYKKSAIILNNWKKNKELSNLILIIK